MLQKIAQPLGDHIALWARGERITITREFNVAEVQNSINKIIWFKREEAKKLLPFIRFGLCQGRTLRETLEEDDRGLPSVPLSILCAITTLVQ